MRLYLDASVLVPLLVQETTSAWVQSRLDGTDDTLLVSSLAVAEVSSAISRFVRTGDQTAESARGLLAQFDAWRAIGSQPLSVDPTDVEDATTLVRRFELKVRAPDAIHLVLARRSGAALMTFDSQLRRAALMIGLPTVPVPRD